MKLLFGAVVLSLGLAMSGCKDEPHYMVKHTVYFNDGSMYAYYEVSKSSWDIVEIGVSTVNMVKK